MKHQGEMIHVTFLSVYTCTLSAKMANKTGDVRQRSILTPCTYINAIMRLTEKCTGEMCVSFFSKVCRNILDPNKYSENYVRDESRTFCKVSVVIGRV